MKVPSVKKESKDVTQKNLESFPDVTADILNVFIYKGKQTVLTSDLYPAPTETEYTAPGAVMRNQLEDISKYEMQAGKIRVQYLLANQSDMDGKMILRKAGYVGAAYREQYDGKVQDKFPVISLVLYWGQGHWSKNRSIRDFFRRKDLSPQIRELIDDIRLHVFEMRNLPPEVREQFQSDMRHVVDYLVEGNDFKSDRPVVHKEALVRLLRALGGDGNVEDTARVLEEMNVKEEDEITMCELFDQYTRRGRQEGRKEGLQALISTCKDLGASFEVTVSKVKEKFSLGEEEARKNMQLYW
ncbi:MAG: Rpn family recombination-promoting nuclease/putative transposase [Butyrivibrio sp.]|nr:Rpn family recombination-promoting nuclease/putative transposase [Acetatifactor muris]MCM1561877.1 Rpn family recombination-promoting nuclease/putative transposase [Butyrivibrio sp.]